MSKREIDRRTFVREGSALVAATAAAGAASGGVVEADPKKTLNYNPKMRYRKLGKTGAFTGSVGLPGNGLVLRNVRDELFDPGGWNTLSVEVRGRRAAVWLNGQQIGAVRCLPPGKGRIGLHLKGGTGEAGSQLAVREIQVRELPAEDSETKDTQSDL